MLFYLRAITYESPATLASDDQLATGEGNCLSRDFWQLSSPHSPEPWKMEDGIVVLRGLSAWGCWSLMSSLRMLRTVPGNGTQESVQIMTDMAVCSRVAYAFA